MSSQRDKKLAIALFTLVLVCAGVILFRRPSIASNLESFPDSEEYATVGVRLATHGTYDITINGVSYPSIYQPWFSMLLAPVYKLLGPEPGNGILPVFLFGVAGIGAAFFLGKRVSGYAGGLLAATFVLLLPYYRLCGTIVLTDVPATAVILMLCLLFLRLRTVETRLPRGTAVAAALLIGLSAALRPATASVVLPFLVLAATQSGRRRILLGTMFLLPLGTVIALEAFFNWCVFGDPLRNGRKVWCPVPWDYVHLTFSVTYIKTNLQQLFESGTVYLLAALGLLHLLLRRGRAAREAPIQQSGESYRAIWLFVVLGVGPLVLLHLVFFYPDPRFFLPVNALLAVVIGGVAGRLACRVPLRTIVLIQAGLLILAIGFRFAQGPDVPKRKLSAEAIRDLTPPNSIIITGIDPGYLGLMLGDQSHRLIVPISRRVDYACTLYCYKRVDNPDPQPTGPRDHRCPGLVKGGAMDVITITATENMDWIVDEMRKGRPVFMETSVLPEDVPIVNELGARFVTTPAVAPFLYRFTLPSDMPAAEQNSTKDARP